jgi:hypothetical protein
MHGDEGAVNRDAKVIPEKQEPGGLLEEQLARVVLRRQSGPHD